MMKRRSPIAAAKGYQRHNGPQLAFSSLIAIAMLLDAGGMATAAVWTTNGPFGGHISRLVMDPSSPTTIYAGTAGGGVFKTTTAGGVWNAATTGLTGTVFTSGIDDLVIDPNSPSTLYAASSEGGVFKTTDGGGSWVAANTGLPFASVYALAINPMSGSWVDVNTGLPIPGLTSFVNALTIDPTNPSTVYAGTYDGIFKTTTAGASWNAMTTAGMTNTVVGALAIDPANPSTLYAGTFGGVFELVPVCGDGLLEGAEQCDNGPGNGHDGCCTTSCTKVSGSVCIPTRSTGMTCTPAADCTLQTPDQTISLTIPAGALNSPTVIEIIGKSAGNADFALGAGSQAVLVADLLPLGQTFNSGTPAALTFSWTDSTTNTCQVATTKLWETDLQVSRDGANLTKVCGKRTATTGVCTAAAGGASRCATNSICVDATCDIDQNTYTVHTTQFSEYALNRPCTEVAAGKLTAKKLDTPPGDDRLALKGSFPIPSSFDPVTDGFELVLLDAGTAVLEAQIPGGAYDNVAKFGWKVSKGGMKWTYVNKTAGPPGNITKVTMQEDWAGMIEFTVKGKNGNFDVSPAVEVSIVPANGECEGMIWPGLAGQPICKLNQSGSTLKCEP